MHLIGLRDNVPVIIIMLPSLTLPLHIIIIIIIIKILACKVFSYLHVYNFWDSELKISLKKEEENI